MSQELKKEVFVGGIYNWPATCTKEERVKGNYERHNWCDIDTTDPSYLEGVLKVFAKYKVDCFSQRVGKGYHVFGDIVPYELWKKIWFEIKPYADPRWAPHTLRITKKRDNELFERPIYHRNATEPRDWARATMSFLCKVIREENSTNLMSAIFLKTAYLRT